jgi:hypothetical protein
MLQQISLVCPLCWQTAGEARSSRQCCSPACKLTHPPAPTHFPPHDPKWWIVLPPQTQTVSVIHWLRRCLTVDDRQQNSGRPARPASTKSMTAEAANVSDLHPPADVRGTLQLLLLYLKTLQLMLTLSALLLPLRKSAGCSHSTPPARRCRRRPRGGGPRAHPSMGRHCGPPAPSLLPLWQPRAALACAAMAARK